MLMTCYLCHRTLDTRHEPTVATTDGGRVHIVCADRAARAAYEARTIRALISAVLLSKLFVVIMFTDGWGIRLVVLTSLLIAAHIWINLLWWHRFVSVIRLQYRLRWRRWRS